MGDTLPLKVFSETDGILNPIQVNGYPELFRIELPDGTNLVRYGRTNPDDEPQIEALFWKEELEPAVEAALKLSIAEALVDPRPLVPEIAKALHDFRKEKAR